MANLLKIIPRVGLAFVMLFLIACRTADSQTTPTREVSAHAATTPTRTTDSPTTQTPTASQLPDWIVNPKTLPPGRVGKNNCKFDFGLDTPKWDVHPDAGCWEHAGPDGWTRQQFQRIHHPSMPQCGGGPGDGTAIRVCRKPGEDSPCGEKTGPKGCARCVVSPKCH
jgi:hypothetical protein